MYGDGYRGAGVDARQLLDRKGVREIVGAGAAVLLGNENPHDPRVGQLLVELARKDVLAIPSRDVRRYLALRDLGRQCADRALLVGELELPSGRR